MEQGMRTEVLMPNLGYDMESAKVTAWLKQVGDPVRRGEPIAEIVPVEPDEEAEIEPLGLVAFVGAMAGRRALLETVGWIVSMRSVARDREPPGIA